MKHEESGQENYGDRDEWVKLGSVSRVFQIEKDLDDAWQAVEAEVEPHSLRDDEQN